MRSLVYFILILGLSACDGGGDKPSATDADGDGYSIEVDCDDGNAEVYPGALEICDSQDNDCDGEVDIDAVDANVYYADEDGDGFGDPEAMVTACSVPSNHVENDADCDDASKFINPSAKEVCDEGLVDEDCDGYIDDDDDSTDFESKSGWYRDRDKDGYGGENSEVIYRCEDPSDESARYSDTATDCDDERSDIHPGAQEVCDGDDADEDCDGRVDDLDDDVDAATKTLYYVDADGDGYGDADDAGELYCNYPAESVDRYVLNNVDCDDASAEVNPAKLEVCDDFNLDENCNGYADDEDAMTLASTKAWYYVDSDGDSFGDMDDAGQRLCDDPSTTTVFYVRDNSDCDDGDAEICPGASEVCDADDVDENCNGVADDDDAGVLSTSKTLYFVDLDKDGYGDVTKAGALYCDDPSNSTISYATEHTDCDDSNKSVNPGANEVCDSLNEDEDCDGLADDNDPSVDTAGMTTGFMDSDGDGYGDASAPGQDYCDLPSDRVTDNTDCDDSLKEVNPGAKEVCDALDTDEDCNGVQEDADVGVDATTQVRYYVDSDEDAFGDSADPGRLYCDDPTTTSQAYALNNTDCDDRAAAVNPTAREICDTANVDEDCNGSADDSDSGVDGTTKSWFYLDYDKDGYGDASLGGRYCDNPSSSSTQYTVDASDCDDTSAAINPGMTEVCDVSNVDENCNGVADNNDSGAAMSGKATFYRDTDGDGYGGVTASAALYCDQPTGFSANNSDCDDALAAVNPDASEVCDVLDRDEDCDGLADDLDVSADASTKTSFYLDSDGDGYGAKTGGALYCDDPSTGTTAFVTDNTDCDDAQPGVNPGADEVCDSADTDEDCDGVADDSDASVLQSSKTTFYLDADGDGYGNSSRKAVYCDTPTGSASYVLDGTDCDDVNNAIHPGADEVCDAANADEDCDGVSDNQDSSALNSTKNLFYLDGDRDGYGSDSAVGVSYCDNPSTGGTWYAAGNTDCDDSDNLIHPGAVEICDASDKDEDCDGAADDDDFSVAASTKTVFYRDGDGDGWGDAGLRVYFCDVPSTGNYVEKVGDCNDANRSVNPDGVEVCDPSNLDEDCNGFADDSDPGISSSSKVMYYSDFDGDGYGNSQDPGAPYCDAPPGEVSDNTDCDDEDANVRPGIAEKFDYKDTNCDKAQDSYGVLSTVLPSQDVRGVYSGDEAGASFAAGDFNGDGFDDFVIGAPGASSEGEVYVFLGGRGAVLPSAAAISDADLIIRGEGSGDRFGEALSSVGDFNGDGYDDLLVGAPGAGAGSGYLFHGGSSMTTFSGMFGLSAISKSSTVRTAADRHVLFKGNTIGDAFGFAVSGGGDLNNDGYPDLAIGAPNRDVSASKVGAGGVVVFEGGCGRGLSCGPPTGVYSTCFRGTLSSGVAVIECAETDALVRLDGDSGGDSAGYSLDMTGDVNDDGYADVVVGAPFDSAGAMSAGAAYLAHGGCDVITKCSATGLSGVFQAGSGVFDLSNATVKWTGVSASHQAGTSVSIAGDLNADGYDDVVVGAPTTANGSAYVLLGGCDGAGSCGAPIGLYASASSGTASLSVSDAILTGESANDFAGVWVSGAGDVNDDGYDDLVIGAKGVDVGFSNGGAAYVLLGGCDGQLCADFPSGLFGLLSSGSADLGLSGARFTGTSANSKVGAVVGSAGDYNGDGYDDILVGAPELVGASPVGAAFFIEGL